MIEAVSECNLTEVLPLIRRYQDFYQVPRMAEEKNIQFFSQFGEGSPFGCQFIYRQQGSAVAFATVYFSFSSTIAEKVAVLNDVFVEPNHRGEGIAKLLIDHCRDYAALLGAVRLQWVTALDNQSAQSAYDKMDTKKSSWHFYTYPAKA